MGTKKTLALLLVFIMVFGSIASASAAPVVCKSCNSTNIYTWTVSDDPELVFYWQYKEYSGSGPHYMRWVQEYWRFYECLSCGKVWRISEYKYGPWEIDHDWV